MEPDRPLDRRAVATEMRAALAALGAEVDRVRQDRGFQETLAMMAMFWRYSPGNQWLIHRALPTATRVAGRRTWEKLGRKVKKDAVPIRIQAPTHGGFPFVEVSVFDVSQTRGRRLPRELDLALAGGTSHAATLERAATRLGVVVTELCDWSHHVGESVGGEIRIQAGLAPRERAATLAHELAHEILHQNERARKRKRPWTHAEEETEAEATSYVVLLVLGLPSQTRAAPTYIAWRGGTGELLARSLGRVQRAARKILEAAGAPS